MATKETYSEHLDVYIVSTPEERKKEGKS